MCALLGTSCSRSLPPTASRLGTTPYAEREAPNTISIPGAFDRHPRQFATSRDGRQTTIGNERGDTVYFPCDSVELTPEASLPVDAQAALLARHRDQAISIEGLADELGTREYNIGLGARRADPVSAYLVTRGQ